MPIQELIIILQSLKTKTGIKLLYVNVDKCEYFGHEINNLDFIAFK